MAVKLISFGAATIRLAMLLQSMAKTTYYIGALSLDENGTPPTPDTMLETIDDMIAHAGAVRADMFELMNRPITPTTTVWAPMVNVPLNTRVRFKFAKATRSDHAVFIGRVVSGRYVFEQLPDGPQPPTTPPDYWAPLE